MFAHQLPLLNTQTVIMVCDAPFWRSVLLMRQPEINFWREIHRKSVHSSAMHKLKKVTLFTGFVMACFILAAFVYTGGPTFKQIYSARSTDDMLFHRYRNCLLDEIRLSRPFEVWLMSADVTKRCQRDTDLLSRLPLMPLENNDETKYVLGVPPVLEAGDECNVVTLGVGNDTMSEVALSQMIPSSCRFYGADPVVEGNEQLYSRIGTFFPYAVAATTGFRMASVLDMNTGLYTLVNISHIDLITFLRQHAKVQIVDYLLMDSESSEFDMLPFFLPCGLLDQNNITVCQWTCEFHDINDIASKRQFADFLWENTMSGRYLPMNFIDVGHIRATLINYQDELCVRRYIRQRRAGNS